MEATLKTLAQALPDTATARRRFTFASEWFPALNLELARRNQHAIDLRLWVGQLSVALTRIGWPVVFEEKKNRADVRSGLLGSADFETHDIYITPELCSAWSVTTLMHEGCHVLLHPDPRTDQFIDRSKVETEAEAAAWLAGRILGVDSTEFSATYIATWRGHELLLSSRVQERVEAVAMTLAEMAMGDRT